MRDDAVLGRALPLDRGLGPAQAIHVGYSICSRRSGLAPLSLFGRPAILGRRVILKR